MEALLLVGLATLGAILGSFVGVVAERIHTGQSFATGRSRCNSCARDLTARDLVPVLSYLLSRGRCFTCGSRVPISYLLLELSLAVSFVWAFLTIGLSLLLPLLLVILVVLAFVVVYDLRHTIVPTHTSNLLVILTALYAVLAQGITPLLGITLLTAGAIGTGFFLMYALSGGRAMGLGDAPIALALSLLAGPYALGGLLLSFWIGGLYGVGILVTRRGGPRMGIEVPFVPFLALGYLLAFFLAWNPIPLL